jgi:hypothetical protein
MKLVTLVLVGLVLGSAAADAAVPASRRAANCAEAKLRAVKRKVDAKLACEAVAVRKRAVVNQLCLANADAAFLKAFARAEAKGGCFNPNGDSVTSGERSVDRLISDVGSLLIPCSPSVSGTLCGPSDCAGRLTLCLSDVSGAPVCTDTSGCRAETCTSDAMCETGAACVTVLGANRCCDICQ